MRAMTNDDDLSPLPTIRTGRYRHYKGGEYQVLGVVRHSESLEPMVLYRPLGILNVSVSIALLSVFMMKNTMAL